MPDDKISILIVRTADQQLCLPEPPLAWTRPARFDAVHCDSDHLNVAQILNMPRRR